MKMMLLPGIIISLCLMPICQIGYAQPSGQNASDISIVPSIPKVTSDIHIKYECTTILPIIPKQYIDSRVKDLNRQIQEASKQPSGQSSKTARLIEKRDWESRGVASTSVSECEYWGSDTKMIWRKDTYSFAYNGSDVICGTFADVVPSLNNDDKDGPGLVVVGRNDRLSLNVPYIGIVQPGMPIFSLPKADGEQQSNGYEETRKEGQHIIYRISFNSKGQLNAIERMYDGHVKEKYTFDGYMSTTLGITLPSQVKHTQYEYYRDNNDKGLKQFKMDIYSYKVTSVEGGSFNEILDLTYPRVGVTIQDFRPQYSTEGMSMGTRYEYENPTMTLDESSQKAYEELLSDVDISKGKKSSIIIRTILLSAVFLLLIIVIRMAVKQKKGVNR